MTEEIKPGTENTKAGEQPPVEKIEDPKPDTKTPEQIAADEKAVAEKKAADEKAAQEKLAEQKKAPDRYELKIPEGSKLDAKHLEKIASFAKERGLSNEDAQAMLDRDNQLLADYAQGQESQLKETTEQWFNTSKEDKELGGENFAKNAELAKRVVMRFGTEEFQKALDATGFSNHPELFRTFYRIGKAMSEDQLVIAGSQSAPSEKSIAEKLYGGNNQSSN